MQCSCSSWGCRLHFLLLQVTFLHDSCPRHQQHTRLVSISVCFHKLTLISRVAALVSARFNGMRSVFDEMFRIQRPETCLHSRTATASRRLTIMSGFGFKTKKDTFKYTGSQRPGVLSPRRTVPDTTVKPDYWSDSKPKAKAPVLPWTITVNTPEEIAGIRAGCTYSHSYSDRSVLSHVV